jgi:CelD/BcsL family acetyltransferase involved in cellulose biosynthesis
MTVGDLGQSASHARTSSLALAAKPSHNAPSFMTAAPESGQRKVPAVTRIHVSRLTGPDGLSMLDSEWEALDAQLSPRTPFTGPLWNRLWWKHYRSRRLLVRDELFLHIARDDHGTLMAVAPMMLTRRPSRGLLQGRVVQCFGADRNITEIRGIICRPEDQAQAMNALARHFSVSDLGWDWIDWGGIREDGTVPDCLEDGSLLGWERQSPDFYLALPATWEELRRRMGRNLKESLRKCYNSLKRDGHAFQLRVVESPAETPAALQIFFRLHRARAHSTTPPKHTDVFHSGKDQAFLTEYALTMAERNQLRIFQLEIRGQVVATRLGFLLGDELYLYYSGYDMRWARYSVMTTTVTEAIKWAIERRLRIANLSTGHDVSKARWHPQSINFRSAIQVSRAWRSRAAFRAYHRLSEIGAQDSLLGKISRIVRR